MVAPAASMVPPTKSAIALVELKMAEEDPWNSPHAAAHRSRKSYTAADRSVYRCTCEARETGDVELRAVYASSLHGNKALGMRFRGLKALAWLLRRTSRRSAPKTRTIAARVSVSSATYTDSKPRLSSDCYSTFAAEQSIIALSQVGVCVD